MKPALLDVNVLISLIDPAHEFHAAVHAWFETNRRHGWATCPITENGCIRIVTKRGYPFSGLSVSAVRDILAELVRLEGHRFWPDSITLLESSRVDLSLVRPRHLTDFYLLSLARSFGGRLVTFDRAIRWQAVTGCGPEDLEILARYPQALRSSAPA
jgi:hypothetical protein